MNKEYSAVDLFSGAGGMSLGAEWAGVKTKIAVENDRSAFSTFKRNFPEATVISKDIKEVVISKEINYKPFIIYGGPPCRGFSSSNSKTRNRSNPLNSLFYEFIRFVNELSPEWVVFENVEGFKSFAKGEIVNILCEELKSMGYTSNFEVITASDYGVPQNRRRFILVANKSGIKFEFPLPLKTKVTVKEALCDLPSLRNGDFIDKVPYKKVKINKYVKFLRKGSRLSKQNYVSKNEDYVIERYKHIKPGENWKAIPASLMKNYKDRFQCHSGIYKRLNPNEPSVVISNYRKNMLIHPTENRGLSVREASRLQSFPDNFIFEGSLMHIQQQIGNAVPPLLAYQIFKKIIDMSNE